MTKLDAGALVDLVQRHMGPEKVAADYAKGQATWRWHYTTTGANPGQPIMGTSYTTTLDNYFARVAIAVAICLAESGGKDSDGVWRADPTAVGTNGPNSSAPGSHDRGLWQFNDRAFPQISDAVAKDPEQSTDWALRISDAWQDLRAWKGSRGLNPAGEQMAAATAAVENSLGNVREDVIGLAIAIGLVGGPAAGAAVVVAGQIDQDANGIPDAAQGVVDALGTIKDLTVKALSVITSADFWRRAGLFAAGTLLVVLFLTQGG